MVGDNLQSIDQELGGPTISAIWAANALRFMSENNSSIEVNAHSQGSSVFLGAAGLLPDDVRSEINYIGAGSEAYVGGWNGLHSQENVVMPGDPIPDISPINLLRNPFVSIVTLDGPDNKFSVLAPFQYHYFIQNYASYFKH